MYQLRSQINILYYYDYKTGVLTCAHLYQKGKKHIPGQILDHIKSKKYIFLLFWTFHINIMIGVDLNFGLLHL